VEKGGKRRTPHAGKIKKNCLEESTQRRKKGFIKLGLGFRQKKQSSISSRREGGGKKKIQE